jgi:phospholipid/cholesterol/gamma-HCH transport system substrate-binding protein
MSTRANPMAIGAFVVGAVALLLVALLVWGGTGLLLPKLHYVLFFDAAVTGLNKGAPLLARGVKVGEVTDVQLQWGRHGVVAVYVILEPSALKGIAEGGPRQALERAVREDGLRAQLRMQSFVTGVLYVALDVKPETPIVLRGLDPRTPELPTIPADLEVWTAKLERFAERIEKIPLDQIGETAAVVLQDVKRIVESKETQNLVRNASAAIVDARTLVRRVDAHIDPLMAQLKGTLARVDPVATEAEATLKAAQGAIGDIRPVIDNMRSLAARLDAEADPLLTSMRKTSDTARATLDRAQLTLAGVDRTLDQESPLGFELFEMMQELRGAASSLRALADYLERVPDAPVYGVRRPRGEMK